MGWSLMDAPAAPLYSLSDADADVLAGIVAASGPDRRAMLASYAAAHDQSALIDLIAQFIGVAKSVTENCREMAEHLLTLQGAHPYEAEKINMPTLDGALAGVKLANSVDPRGACHGCAFRLGSVANQCPSTTMDAVWCQTDVHRFMCHARGVLDDGTPTVRCVGDAKAQRSLVRPGTVSQEQSS